MKPHVSLTMYVHTSSGLRIFQGTLYLGPADSPLDRSDLMCSSCHDPWSMSSHVMGSAGAAAVSRVQYTVHSTQYTVHSTQYTVHSTQYTVHSTQYTVHSPQYTVHSPQYLLCRPYGAIRCFLGIGFSCLLSCPQVLSFPVLSPATVDQCAT
jgi:hypothetical protein